MGFLLISGHVRTKPTKFHIPGQKTICTLLYAKLDHVKMSYFGQCKILLQQKLYSFIVAGFYLPLIHGFKRSSSSPLLLGYKNISSNFSFPSKRCKQLQSVGENEPLQKFLNTFLVLFTDVYLIKLCSI